MSPLAGFLLGTHILLGGAVVGVVWRHEHVRASEVAVVRDRADHDRSDAKRLSKDTASIRALRDGIRTRDPYAVELLARDRLGLVRPGEIPAPAARVDRDPQRQ